MSSVHGIVHHHIIVPHNGTSMLLAKHEECHISQSGKGRTGSMNPKTWPSLEASWFDLAPLFSHSMKKLIDSMNMLVSEETMLR